MAKKKTTRKNKSGVKKNKKKVAIKRRKSARKNKPARKATSARKRTSRPSKRPRPKKTLRAWRRSLRDVSLDAPVVSRRRGLGAGSAGQSGDTQGLSDAEGADFESVEELAEEGQNFEAGIVGGVEDADGSQREVRTKEVLEDDVPLEYREKD